jgi:hypothetical protein
MSRAIQMRWTRRTSRMAGAALRLCVGLWLVLQIVYTPIHLYREPHSDEAEIKVPAPLASTAACEGDEHQDSGDHHERHSATQHKFKVLRSQRAPVAEMVPVTVAAWVVAEKDCPQPPVFEFSGLSPPEFVRSWQFFFRAALPIRAPSVLS